MLASLSKKQRNPPLYQGRKRVTAFGLERGSGISQSETSIKSLGLLQSSQIIGGLRCIFRHEYKILTNRERFHPRTCRFSLSKPLTLPLLPGCDPMRSDRHKLGVWVYPHLRS